MKQATEKCLSFQRPGCHSRPDCACPACAMPLVVVAPTTTIDKRTTRFCSAVPNQMRAAAKSAQLPPLYGTITTPPYKYAPAPTPTRPRDPPFPRTATLHQRRAMAIRMSNNVIRAVTLVTLLLAVPILASGVWLRSRSDGTECDHFLSTPAIALGAALGAVALAGLAGACCRATWLLWLHLLAMLALIVVLLCFIVFAFVVTTKGAAAAGDGDYYSTWLRRHVEGRRTWARIRSCLTDAHVCKRLDENNDANATSLARLGLSPVESGCCKPPTSCNFTYAGGTEWTKTKAAAAGGGDPDCGAWDDDEDDLCYGCRSCKAGVADALKRDWKRAAIVNVVVLAFLVVVYSVGCCAFRNSRRDNYAYHSGRGWRRGGDDA